MKNTNLKNKFAELCKGLKQHDNNCWDFTYDLSNNDPDLPILLEKMWKFVGMLNEDHTKFVDMDIQNEIYDLL